MSWWRLLRAIVIAAVAVAFAISLVAILVTGPIVVTPQERVPEVSVSSERLRKTVETLCESFAPRDYRHPENLQRAAGWIEKTMRSSGLAVEIQDYDLPEGRFRNVIAIRKGSDRDLGAIVLGAHYDAYGGLPGANDNASGVAVLLEVIRTLPQAPPDRDQYFVAFSTEEPPFFGSEAMGSHFFARRLQDRGVEVDLMVALDLVGYFRDEPGTQRFPLPGLGLFYPNAGNFIAVTSDLRSGYAIKRVKVGMLATRALPVRSFRGPASAGTLLSDHYSFRQLGMPGVLVTDTAFLRFPHYHTAEDTPEKLDYERMGQVVVALHGVF